MIEGTNEPAVMAELSSLQLFVNGSGSYASVLRVVKLPADGHFSADGFGAGPLSFTLNPQSGPN
ncbi:MAG TPA: hypothetical protein VI756_30400, partial [Blastocatellia bacterium]